MYAEMDYKDMYAGWFLYFFSKLPLHRRRGIVEWLQEVTISFHIPQHLLVSSPGLGSDDCLSGEELESLCHGHGA
jgi:hypothetical protein